MNETLMGIAGIGGLVWTITELVGRALGGRVSKDLIATVIGLVGGLAAHGSEMVRFGSGNWGWFWAGFAGLLATAMAMKAHDKNAKPVTAAAKGGR